MTNLISIPTYTEGDCLSRYYVRAEELVESVKIIQQCLEKIPKGPHNALETKKYCQRKTEFIQNGRTDS